MPGPPWPLPLELAAPMVGSDGEGEEREEAVPGRESQSCCSFPPENSRAGCIIWKWRFPARTCSFTKLASTLLSGSIKAACCSHLHVQLAGPIYVHQVGPRQPYTVTLGHATPAAHPSRSCCSLPQKPPQGPPAPRPPAVSLPSLRAATYETRPLPHPALCSPALSVSQCE